MTALLHDPDTPQLTFSNVRSTVAKLNKETFIKSYVCSLTSFQDVFRSEGRVYRATWEGSAEADTASLPDNQAHAEGLSALASPPLKARVPEKCQLNPAPPVANTTVSHRNKAEKEPESSPPHILYDSPKRSNTKENRKRKTLASEDTKRQVNLDTYVTKQKRKRQRSPDPDHAARE